MEIKMTVDSNLYEYNNIKNDRLFGINGIINPSLTQEYKEANENFVQYINNISSNNIIKYEYNEYIPLLNVSNNFILSTDYYISVEVDDRYNKLNINSLNTLIMNKHIYLYNNNYKKEINNEIKFDQYKLV